MVVASTEDESTTDSLTSVSSSPPKSSKPQPSSSTDSAANEVATRSAGARGAGMSTIVTSIGLAIESKCFGNFGSHERLLGSKTPHVTLATKDFPAILQNKFASLFLVVIGWLRAVCGKFTKLQEYCQPVHRTLPSAEIAGSINLSFSDRRDTPSGRVCSEGAEYLV